MTVTSAIDVTTKIFVKQRIHNPLTGKFNDVFKAVASPAQLVELPEDAPTDYCSYFRSNWADLIDTNADDLGGIVSDLLEEIVGLLNNLEALAALDGSKDYQITAEGIIIITPSSSSSSSSSS